MTTPYVEAQRVYKEKIAPALAALQVARENLKEAQATLDAAQDHYSVVQSREYKVMNETLAKEA